MSLIVLPTIFFLHYFQLIDIKLTLQPNSCHPLSRCRLIMLLKVHFAHIPSMCTLELFLLLGIGDLRSQTLEPPSHVGIVGNRRAALLAMVGHLANRLNLSPQQGIQCC